MNGAAVLPRPEANSFRLTIGSFPILKVGAFPEDPWVFRVAVIAGLSAGAFHGYRRDGTIGNALTWALLGAWFPFVTIPIAVAQGFGKRA